MADFIPTTQNLPVIIIGAGISGLLLAQQLRKSRIPFEIFERDSDLLTRGVGWGLTLHWSLPALKELLPKELFAQLPNTYVDRAAVERGESSTFPYYDLSTGERKYSSPRAVESQRIRVTRERLRTLLATGIEVKWGKAFADFREDQRSVNAVFEDGSICQGRLIVGCDGSHSQVRRVLYHGLFATHQIPVRLFGFTLRVTAEEAAAIRKLDPFFLQGTASSSNIYMYLSLLEAPQEQRSNNEFLYQICISWKRHDHLLEGNKTPQGSPSQADRVNIIRDIVQDWAEPFRSFVMLITDATDVKQLDLDDCAPEKAMKPADRVMLVGDAFHAMTMYRGEGANHTIVDVLDLSEKVLPHVDSDNSTLLAAIKECEDGIVTRTRSAVLASRQACLDAHDWHGLSANSPLLTRRQMHLD